MLFTNWLVLLGGSQLMYDLTVDENQMWPVNWNIGLSLLVQAMTAWNVFYANPASQPTIANFQLDKR